MPGAAVADVPPQLVMVVQGDDPQEPPLPLIDLDALTSGSESSEIAFGEDDTSTNVDSGDSNNPSPMFSTNLSDDAEIIESWSTDFHLALEGLSLVQRPSGFLTGTSSSGVPEIIDLDAQSAGSEPPPPLQTDTRTYSNDYESGLVADFRLVFGRTPTLEEAHAFAVHDED